MKQEKKKNSRPANFTSNHPKKRSRWGKKSTYRCHCCGRELPFCWNCPCGFQICDSCLKENMWGISNGPTWVCPDCGRVRMF